MIKQGKGKIINISSAIVNTPVGHRLLPYACSKAAVLTMTQLLARALGPYGINVNNNDRTNCRGSPGASATTANSVGMAWAETLASGSQTIKGRFSNNQLSKQLDKYYEEFLSIANPKIRMDKIAGWLVAELTKRLSDKYKMLLNCHIIRYHNGQWWKLIRPGVTS
jgi:NAD(P)-dependent dehydrogenase (short-subunit alcohol dehydrogenase family)